MALAVRLPWLMAVVPTPVVPVAMVARAPVRVSPLTRPEPPTV